MRGCTERIFQTKACFKYNMARATQNRVLLWTFWMVVKIRAKESELPCDFELPCQLRNEESKIFCSSDARGKWRPGALPASQAPGAIFAMQEIRPAVGPRFSQNLLKKKKKKRWNRQPNLEPDFLYHIILHSNSMKFNLDVRMSV